MGFVERSGFGVILQDRRRKSEINAVSLGQMSGSRDILTPHVPGAQSWSQHSRSCPWHHLGPFTPQGCVFISETHKKV